MITTTAIASSAAACAQVPGSPASPLTEWPRSTRAACSRVRCSTPERSSAGGTTTGVSSAMPVLCRATPQPPRDRHGDQRCRRCSRPGSHACALGLEGPSSAGVATTKASSGMARTTTRTFRSTSRPSGHAADRGERQSQFALLGNGSASCWGSSVELGSAFGSTPISVGVSDALQISSSCAVIQGGSIICWGQNEVGRARRRRHHTHGLTDR